ncbi:GNAT family N-acetyltransferase [Thermomonas sp. XSG]|uniref:GNAT family N-acetyltransferase n=1 Tax=Thermomonas sp. XSG TaxID=2771436 RepID=UPI0016815692|nr:GNAT family N-acetyltransferase [Thermomonas sp. XSG]QNU14195.1 GNAT family N-acetyltransferase [Thermomonas sp. XSG]
MNGFRIHRRLSDLPAAVWDALHDGHNPFVAHGFLCGLEATGCLRDDWGWTPLHLGLWEGETLIAAAPGYLKTNSHGEFVFDQAWAQAYAQHGLDYYPKWLCAAPYSPVTGPRLLARGEMAKRRLLEAITGFAGRSGLSSAHINFHDEADEALFGDDSPGERWLLREDIQYHWRNEAGWATFEDYLGAMDRKHRRNIRQERRRVHEAGISFRIVHGDDALESDLAAMHRFYLQTFAEYGNWPALTLDFLRHLARAMPRQLVIVLAEREGAAIAAALCLRGGNTLYGRYWGAAEPHPGLHFETCYYQGIDYCLREGLTRFEPGAQGRHKIARGFLPTLVRSRHHVVDPRFARALRDWCAEERREVRQHLQQLRAHSPFRDDAPA